MRNRYPLSQIEEIIKIDREAGRLLKASDTLYYHKRDGINQELYEQLRKLLDDAKKFPKVFMRFDGYDKDAENLTSGRIQLISLLYTQAESFLKEGTKKLIPETLLF